MKRLIAVLTLIVGLPVALALADFSGTAGSGLTFFSFTCFTTKICTGQVPITSAGVEILPATAANQATQIAAINANGQTTPAASAPVVQAGLAYETIAASATAQVLGGAGATGDFLSHCVIYPVSTSPGVLTVFDSTSSTTNNVITFAGGASSVSNLAPISIPVGAFSVNGPWKVTTGTNLLTICYGRFST